MKWLPLLFCLTAEFAFGQTLSRTELRESFFAARERKSARDSMINRLENLKSKSPVEESYTGICYAYCIESAEGNWAKLKLVLKSRSYLNSGVNRSPNDPELRFLRLVLEHYLPSFLGLNKHLNEDINFIFSHINFIDDAPRVKKKVFEFLVTNNCCNESQKQMALKELEQLKFIGANR